MIDALDRAHARARAHVWKLVGAPSAVTIDLDATLLTAHSDKEGAAGNFKGGYGFHPMLAYCDETRESMGGTLRPGNAGANTAIDQIAVAETAFWSRSHASRSRRSRSCRASIPPARHTNCWRVRTRRTSGSPSATT